MRLGRKKGSSRTLAAHEPYFAGKHQPQHYEVYNHTRCYHHACGFQYDKQ